MIQINLYQALTAVYNAVFSFWNWLDSVSVSPFDGYAFTLLDLFFAVVVFDVLMFLIFGFMGWNDGGED